jgi:hypothetical protein
MIVILLLSNRGYEPHPGHLIKVQKALDGTGPNCLNPQIVNR